MTDKWDEWAERQYVDAANYGEWPDSEAPNEWAEWPWVDPANNGEPMTGEEENQREEKFINGVRTAALGLMLESRMTSAQAMSISQELLKLIVWKAIKSCKLANAEDRFVVFFHKLENAIYMV